MRLSQLVAVRVLSAAVPLTDPELVRRLHMADGQAFEQAYALYAARLLGFLLRLTRRRDLAEDVFQDTWCKLASSARRLDEQTDLFAWLLAVARNAYYDSVRRQSRQQTNLSGMHSLAGNGWSAQLAPDEACADHEQQQLLERALAALSDVDREVLLLVGVEALSHEQATAVLGISAVAFRKRLSRARERLECAMVELTTSTTSSNRSLP